MSKFESFALLVIGFMPIAFGNFVAGIPLLLFTLLVFVLYGRTIKKYFPIICLDESGIHFSQSQRYRSKDFIPWEKVKSISDTTVHRMGLGVKIECNEDFQVRDAPKGLVSSIFNSPYEYVVVSQLYTAEHEDILQACRGFRRKHTQKMASVDDRD